MKVINECPICGTKNFNPLVSTKDFTVSHETFNIVTCTSCALGITNPRPEESSLSKYYESDDYISHSGKSTGLINRVYLIARSFTLRWKYRIIKTNTTASAKKILDYGCGTGDFLKKCQSKKFSIAGVEPSTLAREKASANTGEKIVANISLLQENSFDAITLWHVLEHIPNLSEIVKLLTQRLSQNGTLFIAVPNRLSNDADHYQTFWAGYDVPRHLWHFSPENMKLLLEKNGLKIKSIVPMKLDAYYVSLLSEKYRSGSQSIMGMIRATRSGFRSNHQARKSGNYSSLIYIAGR